MLEQEKIAELKDLVRLAVDALDLAVTIIDPTGTIRYYNRRAQDILDRKPEYLGQDAHAHHLQPITNERFDSMLQAFATGRTKPFHYQAAPYGREILVTLAPLIQGGQWIGCVQSVRLQENTWPDDEPIPSS